MLSCFSHIPLCVTLWTVTCQAPQSMELSAWKISYFKLPQFSSVSQSCLTLCDPMDCSMPGFPVHHWLPELTQTHVYRVSDAIKPSHPLSSPSPPASFLSQHQGLFQWVSSSHKVAKVLEFQLQHQSFQRIFRTDFLEDGLVRSPCSPRSYQESSPTWQFKSIICGLDGTLTFEVTLCPTGGWWIAFNPQGEWSRSVVSDSLWPHGL